MPEIAQSININLAEKLKDKEYRRKFFWAESCTRVAEQLIALRKRRGLNQTQVADLIGTKQPAISRAEQADYQSQNLSTVRKIADALDARVRVYIAPAEDVLGEYEGEGESPGSGADAQRADAAFAMIGPAAGPIQGSALTAFLRIPERQALPQLAGGLAEKTRGAEGEELPH